MVDSGAQLRTSGQHNSVPGSKKAWWSNLVFNRTAALEDQAVEGFVINLGSQKHLAPIQIPEV